MRLIHLFFYKNKKEGASREKQRLEEKQRESRKSRKEELKSMWNNKTHFK